VCYVLYREDNCFIFFYSFIFSLSLLNSGEHGLSRLIRVWMNNMYYLWCLIDFFKYVVVCLLYHVWNGGRQHNDWKTEKAVGTVRTLYNETRAGYTTIIAVWIEECSHKSKSSMMPREKSHSQSRCVYFNVIIYKSSSSFHEMIFKKKKRAVN
jgi:hypothetical protein